MRGYVKFNKYTQLFFGMAVIEKVTEWLRESLGIDGISLNRMKSQALLVDGVWPEHMTGEKRMAVDDRGFTVVRQGMRVGGAPVRTEHFKREFLQRDVMENPLSL